jgi:hypothetical protein
VLAHPSVVSPCEPSSAIQLLLTTAPFSPRANDHAIRTSRATSPAIARTSWTSIDSDACKLNQCARAVPAPYTAIPRATTFESVEMSIELIVVRIVCSCGNCAVPQSSIDPAELMPCTVSCCAQTLRPSYASGLFIS